MKKRLGLLAVVLVLISSGTALAYPRHGRGGHYGGGGGHRGYGSAHGAGGRYSQERCGMYGGGHLDGCPYYGYGQTGVEMPQAIRDKWTEAEKIAVDLRAEMNKRPMDRVKIENLNTKYHDLQREISDWHFNNRLDRMNPAGN